MRNRDSLLIKRKSLLELKIVENLISRYSGEISLWTTHDNISVTLDYLRGAGVKRHRKKVNDNFDMEF